MKEYYIASDYAGINTRYFEFYYGYEVTRGPEDDEEWCFTAKNITDGTVATIPFSKLGAKCEMFNCEECLIAGLTLFLEDMILTVCGNLVD